MKISRGWEGIFVTEIFLFRNEDTESIRNLKVLYKSLQKHFVYFVLLQCSSSTTYVLKNDYQVVSANWSHFNLVLIKHIACLT